MSRLFARFCRNLAVNLLENVDDVVSFDSLKGRIDLASSSSERHKQELHFAMRGYIEHHCRQPCDTSLRILERKVMANPISLFVPCRERSNTVQSNRINRSDESAVHVDSSCGL